MPKTKEQKSQILAELENNLGKSKTVVFTNYGGTSVALMREMRRSARENKIGLRVAKNTLLAKALEKHALKVNEDVLDKPLILAFDENDEVAPAKVIYEKAKGAESLKILGALVNGEFFGPEKVEDLAKLPSREVLLAKLLGSINAPISGFVNVLAGNLRGLVSVLKQYQEKIK